MVFVSHCEGTYLFRLVLFFRSFFLSSQSKIAIVAYNPKLHKYSHYNVAGESTLLEWLLATLKASRTKVKATLAGCGVKVNDRVVTQYDYVLHAGDRVSISQTKENNAFKSRYVKVVYEDEWLVVIEKNVGILSSMVGRSPQNVKTVLDKYFRATHQRCTAHVVHRLDRETSGLMVYAKDITTKQVLERRWHDIVYDRRYVAVVSGDMEEEQGTISSYLKERRDYTTYSSATDNGGKYAVTHFFTLDRRGSYSLVEFRLETGRKNQIRVHAADMGHPVCGDGKYGNGADPLHRLCLHAFLLCMYHPVTGEPMEFSTPIPTAFAKLFSSSRGNQ